MASSPVVAVGGVVLAPGSRVLLVRRGAPPREGAVSLPGGKVEPGESLSSGVAREVLEETGVRVRVVEHLETLEIRSEGYHFLVHDYLCAPIDPAESPRAASDAVDAFYLPVSELPGLGVTPEVMAVVARGVAVAASRAAQSSEGAP